MAAFDDDAYRKELRDELDRLIVSQPKFWTEYKERRIVELSHRIGLERTFQNALDYKQASDLLDSQGEETTSQTRMDSGQ